MATLPKPAQLLLTNQVKPLPWLLPVGKPQYQGRNPIGIMRTLLQGRSRWCFVDRQDGQLLYRKWYDEVRHFSHGFAAVRHDRHWHFINEQGKTVCRHRFLEVGSVDVNGYAVVLHATEPGPRRRPVWTFYRLTSQQQGEIENGRA